MNIKILLFFLFSTIYYKVYFPYVDINNYILQVNLLLKTLKLYLIILKKFNKINNN